MIRRWMLVIGAAIVLVGSLAGTAAAQGPDDPEEGDLVARIAKDLDMTREELLRELLTGKTLQEVAEAQGLAPVVTWRGLPARLSRTTGPVPSVVPLTADRAVRAGIVPPGIGVNMVAEALDMAPEELREALAAGQTVPKLVEERGLDPEAVASEIKGQLIARIGAAIEAGTLNEDRARAAIERLEGSDTIQQWLSGEISDCLPPRRVLQLGRRTLKWLRRHPAAARIVGRRLERWLPGLSPYPAPAE